MSKPITISINVQKRKRGDVCPDTGLVFWQYARSAKNGEHWISREHFEMRTEAVRLYQIANRDKINARRAAYRAAGDPRYIHKPTPERKRKDAERYQRSKPRIRQYINHRRRTIPTVKLADNIRTRMLHALKGGKKRERTIELLGCSITELQQYLERLFLPGMTWANHGMKGWHIDHIVPCSAFDLTMESHRKACFHYTNLQPLWGLHNLTKGYKITKPAQLRFA